MKTIKKAQPPVVKKTPVVTSKKAAPAAPKKKEEPKRTWKDNLRDAFSTLGGGMMSSQEYPVIYKTGGKKKMKSGGSFPDLNKDGKVTKKDVLIGRGVLPKTAKKGTKVAKSGAALKKQAATAIGGGYGGSSYFQYTPNNGYGGNGGSGGGASGYSDGNTGRNTSYFYGRISRKKWSNKN